MTSANVACGLHAGDALTMRATVALAQRHGVAVGAHPGYDDREGFGRRPKQLTAQDIKALLVHQLAALDAIARSEGAIVRHVKPHGALYNQADADDALAAAIVAAVRAFDPNLRLVGRAGSAILGHQLGSSRAAPGTSRARQLTVVDPYAAGGTWYKGNLQVASVRGVGKDLPKTLGAWYAAHGYAFLGISDMNTYTWPEEYGSRALPGVATVDATYPFADLLAIGIDHWLPAQPLQR